MLLSRFETPRSNPGRFMTQRRTTLHYVEAGGGPTLVALHGFPHDHTLWQAQLGGLAEAARVVAPDLRGFGGSPAPDETMSMRAYATDVRNLLRGLNTTPAVLMGLSMGGYVALAFAALFPEAVRALILCSTRATADSPEARARRLALARRVAEGEAAAVVTEMVPAMTADASRRADPEMAERVRQMMLRQPAPGVAAALRGMAERPDRQGSLPALRAPTLAISGSADTLIPPEETEAMARAMPNSRFVLIPGVGHLPPVENPEAFNKVVLEFLARLPA